MIALKSKRELDEMRKAGKLVAQILEKVAKSVAPGVSLLELDTMAEKLTLEAGAKPAFKGYGTFQHTMCLSVNDQVVHGIPTQRKLKEGDILGLDYGLVLNGFYGDSAVTVAVGNVSDEARQLMDATRDSLYAAIERAVPGNTLKDLARGVESVVRPHNYGIVREFVGHGIGRKLHEEPQIPNYSEGASNLKLVSGMTIAIEPMINAGEAEVKVLSDGWTAVTCDGKLSAHFEHTIAIIDEKGAEILTEWPSGRLGKFS